jgi:putative phage-type endonuclease
MESQPEQAGTPPAVGASEARYFVAIGGETYGPYTGQELVRYVEESRILRKDLAWREGLSDWTSVANILEETSPSPPEEGSVAAPRPEGEPAGRRKPKSRLHKLTSETIRQTTKGGDLPLHRGARNGTFDEIPRELLTVDLFLAQNNDGETALHAAARKCNLHQIPPEFFTRETLSVTEKWGRTPLHIAAEFGCLAQMPAEILTPQLLSMRTKNGGENSVIHEAARSNLLDQIPSELLTRELLEQRNAYGETPLQTLERCRPTEKQLAYLRDLGVQADATTLTKHTASILIDNALAGIKPTVTSSVRPVSPVSFAPTRLQSCPFNIVELTQGTPEWRKWRCNGIGASDAPTIMGENPWKTAAELLWEKRGEAGESEVTAAMARGTELEPEARRAYILQTGRRVQPACLQTSEYAWLRASVDGITSNLDAVVEIKCGESVYRNTSEYRRVPDHYYGQLQHILAVTGLPLIDFWCYLPGLPALLIPVERDDSYIERLLHTEFEFWMQVLRKGVVAS